MLPIELQRLIGRNLPRIEGTLPMSVVISRGPDANVTGHMLAVLSPYRDDRRCFFFATDAALKCLFDVQFPEKKRFVPSESDCS